MTPFSRSLLKALCWCWAGLTLGLTIIYLKKEGGAYMALIWAGLFCYTLYILDRLYK